MNKTFEIESMSLNADIGLKKLTSFDYKYFQNVLFFNEPCTFEKYNLDLIIAQK